MKRETKLGILLIIFAVLILIIAIVVYAIKIPDNNITPDEEKLNEQENAMMLNDILSEGSDNEDMNKEEVKNYLNIKITVSDKILNQMGGDREKFNNMLIDFLLENDLATGITQITCTELFTINYKTNDAFIELEANDVGNTVVTVEYHEGTYKFNFR